MTKEQIKKQPGFRRLTKEITKRIGNQELSGAQKEAIDNTVVSIYHMKMELCIAFKMEQDFDAILSKIGRVVWNEIKR